MSSSLSIPALLSCGEQCLELTSPQVMGILNVTPDSFSDGSQFIRTDAALHQVEKMVAAGASIIDIGGESTRPGAIDVSEQDEINRVIPILKAVKQRFDVIVSVDTSKAVVMSEAIASGAGIINDVCALQNEGCLAVMAQSSLPVCLMHMQGQPRTMQAEPQYKDVVQDIKTFFEQRIIACEEMGIAKQRLILDPGFGFGKTLAQNYQLLAHFNDFHAFGLPLLAGLSRKSMIGNLLNRKVDERLAGSLATALLAAQQGAHIIRVHDVKETVDVLKILQAVKSQT